MGTKIITFAVSFCLLFLIGCSGSTAQDISGTALDPKGTAQDPTGTAQEAVSVKAPAFTLKNVHGDTVSLSDFKGNVVIIDFFASWCPPCRQEIPDFIELTRQYGAQGFTMIGISLENLSATKSFFDKMGMNYQVLIDDGRVSNAYGPIRGIPTTFVIDRNGDLVSKYVGFRPKEVFERDIKSLL